MKTNGRIRSSFALVVLSASLVGAAELPVTAATAAGAAAVALQPTVGPPTTKVTLSGTGFGVSESVVVRFDTTKVATATSDGSGAVSTTFRVPKSALPGPHTVKAAGQTSGNVATTTFTVRTEWTMAHFDAANTGHNPYENVLTADNLGSLTRAGTGATNNPAGSPAGAPVIANGVVYMTSYNFQSGIGATRLSAFSASCLKVRSQTCQPLWQADAAPVDIAVSHGVVYVALSSGQLAAYNAAGKNAYCTGTPKICMPLWIGSIPGATNLSGQAAVVANGTVYFPNANALYAFNAKAPLGTGAGKCAGSFPNKTCNALWSTSVGIAHNTCCIIRGKPAVANRVVYISAGRLYAVDATNGALLWASPDVNNPAAANGSPTVAGGVVYSNTGNGILSAFNTSAPDSNCTGTSPARICTPTWSTGVGYSYATPTIANGVIYGTGFNVSTLQAIDTSGNLLWTTVTGATNYKSSPAVANGIVYVGNANQTLTAYSATATPACTGTPLKCPPLYTSATAGAVFTPAIADGIVYGANGTSTTLTAFRLH